MNILRCAMIAVAVLMIGASQQASADTVLST